METKPSAGKAPAAAGDLVRFQQTTNDALAELLRIVSKAAAGDFSEKPRVRDADDELGRFLVAFRFMLEDLELARKEEDRRRAEIFATNDRLRELDRLKSNFINIVAHELSTPLTPIRLETHLLSSGKIGNLSDQQRKAVQVLDRNVDRLNHLVGDLLDISRLQTNRTIVNLASVDLGQVIDGALASFRSVAEEKGVRLKSRLISSLPILGDARRLAQVLDNLLNNALKFTPAGGEVVVEARPEAGSAIVTVTDNGIGMAPQDFSRLFQPFSQLRDATIADNPGSGLGLYISKGIIEQHDGRIWCDSPGKNKGSTFAFSVALEGQKETPPSAAPTGAAGGPAGPVAPSGPAAEVEAATAEAKRAAPRKNPFALIHFSCPSCRTHDITMRILRNIYECQSCGYRWR